MAYAGAKGVVFSAFLFAVTVVLFPYLGTLLTVTCRHEKPTEARLPSPPLTAAHADYLEIGEKSFSVLYLR